MATKGANQSSSTDYEQYGYDAVGNRRSLRKRDGRNGAMDRLYDDVLAFEESLGARFDYAIHVGDFGMPGNLVALDVPAKTVGRGAAR